VSKNHREVPASEIKNAWHEYLDRVSRGREEIVVTRYGKPVAKLVPVDADESGQPRSIFGMLRGSAVVHGDIISPIDEVWDAER
jgi:prevent-host-death family protein